jgi:transposase InsO family protein
VDLHANAALTARQRQRVCDLVAAGVTITAAASVVGCSRQTASKWVGRGRRGEGVGDRSSRPHRSPRRTPAKIERAILRAREELREGPHVIGWAVGVAASTVHAVLRRHGRSRLVTRPPRDQIVRYERERPGELVHVDIKKLGRILRPGHRVTGDRSSQAKGKAGWQYLYVAIDDHSRLGYASIHPDETSDSAIRFLAELVRFYEQQGIRVERVLTDNGTCFKRRWSDACAAHGIAAKRTRAYRPQTNGKAERFIRTLLERWAYAYSYEHESQRLAALGPALDFYNRFRPHRALGGLTPLQRVNNVPGTYN